jgi:hypothetical protein
VMPNDADSDTDSASDSVLRVTVVTAGHVASYASIVTRTRMGHLGLEGGVEQAGALHELRHEHLPL